MRVTPAVSPACSPAQIGDSLIVGSGEMASLIRSHNWNSTALGAIETWPPELIVLVNLTLSSAAPTRILWGPEFLLIYNDSYRQILGSKHPLALGQAAKTVWGEVWESVGPQLKKAYLTGMSTSYEKLPVTVDNDGTAEHLFLTYSYSPIHIDKRIVGLFGHVQYVTAEVVALQQLKDSEARFSRILKSIGDAVIVTDAEAHITLMNPVAAALTGWTEEEARGRPLADVFDIVSEDTRLAVESPAAKVKRLGNIVGLANHTVLIAKGGIETHIDDSAAPIRDDDGKLTGIVLVFRNIDERREAERQRDAVTKQLEEVMRLTTDSIVSVNRDWIMTYMNPKALEVYGSDRQLIGRNVWEAFPGAVYEGSPYVEHYYRAMNEGIPGGFDAHYPEPLNLWLHIAVYPAPEGIVTFSRDITEETLAREALHQKSMEAERQRIEIESVYQTAPIGLALFDAKDFRYLRLNNKQAEFFGLRPDEIVGRTLTEMAPIEGLQELFEGVRDGKPVVNFPLEGELANRPGEHRYWTVSYFPVIDADGSVQAITAASLEVTQQKKAESALIQSEKLAAVGRLASTIAHEINNPLESVTNLLYLACGVTDLPVEAKEYLDMAERELRRVSVITNQTLRFQKQTAGATPVTAEELVSGALQMYQGRLLNSRIQVEARYRADLPIHCYAGEIRQVLNNLIGNAIDAMAAGGRLHIRTRHTVQSSTSKEGVLITVADTGAGMSQAVRDKVFDAFFTTKGIGGTGLGLWVSQEIIIRHEGKLGLRTSQDIKHSGTVFTVFLPREAAAR